MRGNAQIKIIPTERGGGKTYQCVEEEGGGADVHKQGGNLVITALYTYLYRLTGGVGGVVGLVGGVGGIVGLAGGVGGVVGLTGGVGGVVGLDLGSGCLVIFFTSFLY